MSNALFNPGREWFAEAWLNNDIRVMLVKSTYTFVASHKFLSDMPASTYDNGRSAALGTKTVTDGIADAADMSLVATAAVACNALAIFYHTGSDATARLIGYIDAPTAGLPFTPSAGQTVNITFDNGANRIFKL